VIPSAEYDQRRVARMTRVDQFEMIHIRLGNVRLLLAAAVVVLAWLAFGSHLLSGWWIAAPIVVFGGIAVEHSRVLRARDLAQRAVSFYERGLARVQDRWAGTGETGERFADPHHVYSGDLDLFGDASLFQLMSVARTRMGEETLVGWLLAPASVEEIRDRQLKVGELRGEIDLGEDLAVLGEDAKVGVHPNELAGWAESSDGMNHKWMAWLAPCLGVMAIIAVIIWAVKGTVTPFVIVVVVEAILTYWVRKKLDDTLHGTEHAFRDLELLAGLLERFEKHSFRGPQLQALQRELLSSGFTASRAISKLRSLVDFINSRHNVFVRIIDAPLMYSVQVAFAAERWRTRHGNAVRRWVAVVGEMEALLSLASYSFEHPEDHFPEFLDGAASFEAEEIGHPLLPAAVCVRNSVDINGETRILLISGSNMSGKSTLLRSVGINVVLAMAGGPVRAKRLRMTPLQVGASIRVNDSLQEGSSRFYAEIKRLRQILDFAGKKPHLLFLLDELLQGTNSNDRRIGSEGIVKALVDRGAVGMVSTHDLALTNIGGVVGGHLRNVHFQDELANGKITFDYVLRDGVVTKSNGLELMRSIGLNV
jgi:MutS domain V